MAGVTYAGVTYAGITCWLHQPRPWVVATSGHHGTSEVAMVTMVFVVFPNITYGYNYSL